MHKTHPNSIANRKNPISSKYEENLVFEELQRIYPDSIIQKQYFLSRGKTTVDFYVKTSNDENIFIEWKGGIDGSHGPGLSRGDQIKDLIWLATRVKKEVELFSIKNAKFIGWTTGLPKSENQRIWIQDAIDDGLIDEIVVFVPSEIVNQLVFENV